MFLNLVYQVCFFQVKGSLYMKNNPDNLEDTDLDGFLRFCVTHVNLSASTDSEFMIQLLTGDKVNIDS